MASAPWSSPTASSPARNFGSGCATITAAHSSPSPSHNSSPEPALGPSRGHSAHVGQEAVVHYRWHPLHGRRVRRQCSEDRLAGRFVHVEVAPGVVTVMAAWMLDPVACAGMELGPPRVSVSALADLHQLLIERGSRRCSRGGLNTVQEEHHGAPPATGTAIPGTPPP